MPKVSNKKNKNVYFRKREELKLTREQASELLESIPPERIEKIENERVEPHPEEILIMAEKYKSPEMCNYYCSNQCPIGQTYVPEIKMKDFDMYRSFYCGLCRELREKYGISGQITLSYDMTFVIMLLSGLYEPKTYKGTTRCILHPMRKQPVRKNVMTEYCADMNILLTYYKCLDDWNDDRKYVKLGYARLLEGKNNRLLKLYPDKAKRIVELLDELSALEKQGETDIDRMSGVFGHIMEEILAYRQDEWEKSLRRIGFYLGKFIYLLDAYDDVEEDVKNKDYNPFAEKYTMEGFEGEVRQILMMMMAETCREFEKLPIIKYGDILRNILYSGVWCRFEEVSRKRREEREKEHVGSI